MIRKIRNLAIILTSLALLQSCGNDNLVIKGENNLKLKQVQFSDLENWDKDNHQQALRSFLSSCQKFLAANENVVIGKSIGDIKNKDLVATCKIALSLKDSSSRQAKNFFESQFRPFLVINKASNEFGTFTGYYEPNLKGSRHRTNKYRHPVYGKPENLNLTRKQITDGALGKELELLYVEDKTDLFFLQIQGSGRVILDDGTEVRISYAAKNNYSYSSIGKYLQENFKDENIKLTANGIKDWLRTNEDKADEVMNVNESYVFFKISDTSEVKGAQNVALTAERSLAVDDKIIPYGFPIWLNTVEVAKNGDKKPFQKLLITQDTGSAIKGVVRGDIFFGYGSDAENRASTMKSIGKYYIFLPIGIIERL